MSNTAILPPQIETEYPVIDTDPHFKRVLRYARPSDYYVAVGTAGAAPGLFLLMERFFPTNTGRRAIASNLRLVGLIGVTCGFLRLYSRSSHRFWGWRENAREVEMDMREMVDRVKRKEPLYGESSLSPYHQGVAARNSRYSQTMLHAIPMFNFVNHNQHGVDTAKYYRAAEEELEREERAKAGRL